MSEWSFLVEVGGHPADAKESMQDQIDHFVDFEILDVCHRGVDKELGTRIFEAHLDQCFDRAFREDFRLWQAQ